MKIEKLIEHLHRLQKIYPNSDIYFTDGNDIEWFETFFQAFNVDESENKIEMLFGSKLEAREGKYEYPKITTAHNIVDILTHPDKYIDEYSDTEILTLPDDEACGGILRFLVGVEDGDYYIVVEDDYSSDDIYQDTSETLIQTFVRVLNDNIARK